MNTAGLAILVRMGNCLCFKQSIKINSRRYYKRGRIGEGGFSTVDLVEDATTHKLYALKRITCHASEDQKIALAEVEYHKVFSHPNIMEIVDSDLTGAADIVGNQTSEVLMLMPYYQRGTLHDELMRRQKTNSFMDQIIILTMFRCICEAVQVMHGTKPHPLAHRDIKTANVLLKDDFTPIVMDLGSTTRARVEVNGSSDAHKLQDEAGERSSMPYRAPELFNVESFCKVDERTDVWSLGCLLYAMCFFKSPFDAVYERGDSVALAVVNANISFPNTHPFSQEMLDLINSMMVVQPDERPYVDWVINNIDSIMNKAQGSV